MNYLRSTRGDVTWPVIIGAVLAVLIIVVLGYLGIKYVGEANGAASSCGQNGICINKANGDVGCGVDGGKAPNNPIPIPKSCPGGDTCCTKIG